MFLQANLRILFFLFALSLGLWVPAHAQEGLIILECKAQACTRVSSGNTPCDGLAPQAMGVLPAAITFARNSYEVFPSLVRYDWMSLKRRVHKGQTTIVTFGLAPKELKVDTEPVFEPYLDVEMRPKYSGTDTDGERFFGVGYRVGFPRQFRPATTQSRISRVENYTQFEASDVRLKKGERFRVSLNKRKGDNIVDVTLSCVVR